MVSLSSLLLSASISIPASCTALDLHSPRHRPLCPFSSGVSFSAAVLLGRVASQPAVKCVPDTPRHDCLRRSIAVLKTPRRVLLIVDDLNNPAMSLF